MTSQLWPPMVVDPSTLTWDVTGTAKVKSLPGIGRGLALYGGLIGQMKLDQVKAGQIIQPRPRVLQRPDMDKTLKGFITDSVEEYIIEGNSCSLVTARDSRGLPAAVKWFPSWCWSTIKDDDRYYLNGSPVQPEDVLHVKRGSDPMNPRRGIGIVEQHLKSLERAGLQEEYERQTLRGGGVPSVAVIAPQKELTQAELDEAGDAWQEKFGGPVRRPGIFPAGTQIETLSWSPNDQQMVLARQMTLTDVANMMNLDSYWLGAPASSHTYRTPGVMFLVLLRTSLEGILPELEDAWGQMLLPYGNDLRFDRTQLTRDDMASMISTFVVAVREGLMTVDECRVYMGLTPFGTTESTTPRIPSATPDTSEEPEPAISVNTPKEGDTK